MLHKIIAAGDIHQLANWVVANLAARNALVLVAADKHKLLHQTDTGVYYFLVNDVGPVWQALQAVVPASTNSFILPLAVSDETSALTAGTAKITFRMPRAMTLSAVRASLTVAQVGGALFTVDIKEAGVSILSTKITLDNAEKSSVTALAPPVISDAALADDAEITIDITQIGDGTAKGLKVYLIGS